LVIRPALAEDRTASDASNADPQYLSEQAAPSQLRIWRLLKQQAIAGLEQGNAPCQENDPDIKMHQFAKEEAGNTLLRASKLS